MAKNLMSVFGAQNGKGPSSAEPSATTAEADSNATQELQGTTNRLPVIVLGKTLVFKGELSADEDLLLFGRVEGSIRHTSNLTVGAGGTVIGDIHAKVLTVKGTVDGDLEATESISVSPTGNVLGDITAPRVCILEDAQFNGSVKMTEALPTEAKTQEPAKAPDSVLSDKALEQVLGAK
jgi:cytoskeletal protein CcmA (bactofilin family)